MDRIKQCRALLYFFVVIILNTKSGYLSSAFLLLASTIFVKVIGAIYKIPLTAFIGGVGRGYFAAAYNLYMPLHAVLLGAFPIALSRLVSQYRVQQEIAMLAALRQSAWRLLLFVGTAGTLFMLFLAKPYVRWIVGAPQGVYTILVLAPSLLFSCLAAAYRGYYEGTMHMIPTAVSQAMEALFKLVFGLLFAKLSMAQLLQEYQTTGRVLGKTAATQADALQMIYPLTSSAAMLGVTLGTFISFLYLFIYDAHRRPLPSAPVSLQTGRRTLMQFAFPILLSCAVQSVFQFLDTASLQFLVGKSEALIQMHFRQELVMAGIAETDAATYAYGVFATALDFKNLIPGVTMALGVCAVPALCREYAQGNTARLQVLTTSVYRYTALLSACGAVFMALCSEELLTLFYGASSPDIVSACTPLVRWFAWTVPVYSMASTAVFSVQAIGCPQKSVVPYAVAGVLRVALNFLLVRQKWFLFGAVLAGAIGYLVLFLWHVVIVKREAALHFEGNAIVIKPFFVAGSAYFLSKYLFFLLSFPKNMILNLLMKGLLFGSIFYILCIIFGALRFEEIFCGFNFKKNA